MRCPNCHSVVGNNQGLCQYCGYDIGEYVRIVQNNGTETDCQERDKKATKYVYHDERSTQSVYNYENGYFYYKHAYETEKGRNDQYKKNFLYGAIIVVLILHLVELLALAAIYAA